MGRLRILHLEDNADDHNLIRATLELAGIDAELQQVSDRAGFKRALSTAPPDLVLADYMIPRFSGLEGLKLRNELAPDIPLIFVTGSLGDDLAVTTLRHGATDFVLKDRMARLPDAIRRALDDGERLRERRRLDAALTAERELLRATLQAAQAAIVILDAAGGIVSANPMAARLTGHPLSSLTGQAFWSVFPAAGSVDDTRDHIRAALDWQRATESWPMTTVTGRSVMWSSGTLDHGERNERLVLSGIDVTEQRKAEREAHFLGNFDSVTGLPNRRRLLEELEACCQAREAGDDTTLALILIALQRLEEIADSDGDGAIDGICVAVTERLRALRVGNPLLARVSDNGFALAADTGRGPALERLVHEVLDALAAPLRLNGRQQIVPVRLGAALLPDDAPQPRQLLRAAEAALHHAETDAGRDYAFYTPALSDHARERLQLESELRAALSADDELSVHYQPQVDLRSGRIVGLESLIRWRHPRLDWLSPGRFIPLAEVSGLMHALGNWVLRAVCRQLAAWDAAGIEAPVVAVNLSASQFAAPTLVPDIERILAEHGTAAERIELELTESASMRDPQSSVAIMGQLRERGLKIAIDDFGTGYSNLSYLKRFPVNRLKLDQTFVRDIATDGDDLAISRAIIAMAHQLRLEVVAEGIETAGQLDLLAEAGCDIAQGYLLSRPVDAPTCQQLLARGASLLP